MEQTKRCSICNKEKPISEFNKDAKAKQDGHRSECKICSHIKSIGYRARIRETNTILVIEQKVCLCCGINKPANDFYNHIGHLEQFKSVFDFRINRHFKTRQLAPVGQVLQDL